MTTIVTTDVQNGQVTDASLINNNFTAIKTVVNGSIDNSNLDPTAAISVAKLATGTEGYILKVVSAVPTWAPQTTALAYGTSLPGSPANGDEAILVDSTSAASYIWRFRFNSSRATNKWEFVGGAPGFVETATNETTTSASYANLSGGATGPSFAIPIAGDYIVAIGYTGGNNNGTQTDWMSYDIGATGANDNDGIQFKQAGAANNQIESLSKAQKKTGLTAVTLTCKYKTTGNTASYAKRFISITPVAVGG